MNPDYLDFEQPIAEIEAKINELRYVGDADSVHIAEEIETLKKKSQKLTDSIFSKLSPWQSYWSPERSRCKGAGAT